MLQKKEDNLVNQITKICLIVANTITIIAIIVIVVSLINKNEELANKYAITCYYALFIDVFLYCLYVFFNKK